MVVMMPDVSTRRIRLALVESGHRDVFTIVE
jgi:hypothetical protein